MAGQLLHRQSQGRQGKPLSIPSQLSALRGIFRPPFQGILLLCERLAPFAGSCAAAGCKPTARLAHACAWVFVCVVVCRCGLQACGTVGKQALSWRHVLFDLPRRGNTMSVVSRTGAQLSMGGRLHAQGNYPSGRRSGISAGLCYCIGQLIWGRLHQSSAQSGLDTPSFEPCHSRSPCKHQEITSI